jgi:hypothetical protein
LGALPRALDGPAFGLDICYVWQTRGRSTTDSAMVVEPKPCRIACVKSLNGSVPVYSLKMPAQHTVSQVTSETYVQERSKDIHTHHMQRGDMSLNWLLQAKDGPVQFYIYIWTS